MRMVGKVPGADKFPRLGRPDSDQPPGDRDVVGQGVANQFVFYFHVFSPPVMIAHSSKLVGWGRTGDASTLCDVVAMVRAYMASPGE